MKIFCSKCGQAKDVEESAAGSIVTCAHCGNRFGVGGQAPRGSDPSKVVLIVVAAVMVVPVIVAIIGILAAIAIPNFIRFQARSKQSECRTNLKALSTTSRLYFQAHQQHTAVLRELDFSPERGNRYAYFAGPGTQEDRTLPLATRSPDDTQIGVDLHRYPGVLAITQVPARLAGDVTAGVSGTCPDCNLVAVCVGNIDNDKTLDVWSVSTADRRGPSGDPIPAGTPYNDVNDVTE